LSKNPESRLVQRIVNTLESKFPGCYVRKIHGNPFQHAGIPDLVGCLDGLFFGFEVKTDTGKTTKIQELEGESIRTAGGLHAVIRSPEEAVKVLKDSLKSV